MVTRVFVTKVFFLALKHRTDVQCLGNLSESSLLPGGRPIVLGSSVGAVIVRGDKSSGQGLRWTTISNLDSTREEGRGRTVILQYISHKLLIHTMRLLKQGQPKLYTHTNTHITHTRSHINNTHPHNTYTCLHKHAHTPYTKYVNACQSFMPVMQRA